MFEVFGTERLLVQMEHGAWSMDYGVAWWKIDWELSPYLLCS